MARKSGSARSIFDASIEVVGGRSFRLSDLYHVLLGAPWWATLCAVAVLFLLTNCAFALAYMATGGVVNVAQSSFSQAFFFSVQTLATIGYGQMYPATVRAMVVMTAEVLTGILEVALVTGLVFAKFSVPRARVIFSRNAVVTPFEGAPTLMFRVANERGNHVVEAQVRVSVLRFERTAEGQPMSRMRDLKLTRERSPAFVRTWLVLHPITPDSPLYGATPETLVESRAQLIVTLTGIDGTSGQSIHARYAYVADEIVFGARFADVMFPTSQGGIRLDMSRFHELVPEARA